MQENNLVGKSYAEPYAGGAGLALRLLFEGYIRKAYINDFDRCIFAFWKSIIDNSDDFCNWIEQVSVTMDSWYRYRAIRKNAENEDIFELGKATFFLNRTNVSGVINGGVIGGYKQKGKYKLNARFNKKDLIERIQKIALFKDRIEVSNLDGIEFIKQMDQMEEEIFVYLDPPYYQKGYKLYMNYYAKKDHEQLSEYVHKMKKRWMVSYDNHEFIHNLYSGKQRLTYKLSQSASNRVGDEIIVFCDSMDFQGSMDKLKEPVLV